MARSKEDYRQNQPGSGRHRATVSVGFVTGMLSGLIARNIDFNAVLESSGIARDALARPDGRVSVESYAALYNTIVRRLDDEGFALFSQPLRLGCFEFLCRSVVDSRTLGEALERATRFFRLVLPDLGVSVSRRRASAEIQIAESRRLYQDGDDQRRIFAFEWLLRLLHGLACWLVGRGLSLDSVRFPYSRPAHAADYALIYTARSSFGGKALVASLNANLLDLPIRRDAEALSLFLEGSPGKIAMLYRRDREMVRQVRDMLASSLVDLYSLDEVARRLNLSPRTLHRRLQEEGSSYRAIKDALRRDVALSRLEKTRQPISQIAADLGFSEPSTFFRAFQGWTGIAPTTYRQRLARGIDSEDGA